MNRLQFFLGRSFLLLIPLFLPVHSIGKGTKQKNSIWAGNWKFDLRTGYGAFLSEVPLAFLDRLNGVNIPVRIYSPVGVFALRKDLSPHFEMGYQLDYIRVNGFVSQEDKTFKVSTTALANNMLILYKFRREDESSPRLNYQVYYKIGSQALKNDARQRFADGSLSPVPEQAEGDQFIRKKALTTGIGLSANWRFLPKLSLVANLEFNHSTYRVSDIVQPQTIFLHSEKTLTNSGMLTVGLSYSLHAAKPKARFTHPAKKMHNHQIRYKHNHRIKRRDMKGGSHSVWYKQKKRR